MMKKRGRPLKGSEKLETRLGFRIPQSLHERVLKVCDAKGINKTDFIVESIQKNLDQNSFSLLPEYVQEEILQKKRIV